MGDVFAKILGLQTQKNQSRSPSLWLAASKAWLMVDDCNDDWGTPKKLW